MTWNFKDGYSFLNHGSFGKTLTSVRNYQNQLRDHIETDPFTFFVSEFQKLLKENISALADFVGADAENMVPVKNASMGVNAVLRSLNFNKGDEIVFSDHSYLSCKNTIEFLREKRGIVAKQISIPFPCSGDDQIIDIFLRNLSSRTKLVLLDHITSPTALILPLENLLPEIKKLGILSLVDGAHGPGMLKLKLNELAADFYVGNCHKWLCSARGAAFLHINKDFSGEILPNCISNGYKLESEKSSQLFNNFSWQGTDDWSAFLSLKKCLEDMAALRPGGWDEIRHEIHDQCIKWREIYCQELKMEKACPDSMLGSMFSFHFGQEDQYPFLSPFDQDLLGQKLWKEHKIQSLFYAFGKPTRRLLRLSFAIYNQDHEYEKLLKIIKKLA